MTVRVHVIYWGGWGYGSKFRRLEGLIQDEFSAGDVNITSESTPGITGWFEVKVNDTLIHSKKNGDGYVDSEAKLQKIYEAIEAASK